MFDNEEEIMRKFGANVRKYRNRLKLTQEMLAEKCECSPQTISGTETGYSFPSSKLLFKLAEVLNIPIMYLFNFGEDTIISNQEEDLLLENSISKLTIEQKRMALRIIEAILA